MGHGGSRAYLTWAEVGIHLTKSSQTTTDNNNSVIHNCGQFSIAGMFLEGGRRAENPEEAYTDMGMVYRETPPSQFHKFRIKIGTPWAVFERIFVHFANMYYNNIYGLACSFICQCQPWQSSLLAVRHFFSIFLHVDMNYSSPAPYHSLQSYSHLMNGHSIVFSVKVFDSDNLFQSTMEQNFIVVHCLLTVLIEINNRRCIFDAMRILVNIQFEMIFEDSSRSQCSIT